MGMSVPILWAVSMNLLPPVISSRYIAMAFVLAFATCRSSVSVRRALFPSEIKWENPI